MTSRVPVTPVRLGDFLRANVEGIYLTSEDRTVEGNRSVGGSPRSWHLQNGRAVDIRKTPGMTLDRATAPLRSAGWTIHEALDEGDHFHIAASPPGSGAGGGSAPARTSETDDNRETLSDEQIYAIGDTLAKDDDAYKANPLNAYLNTAYHFKLTMVSDSDFLQAGGASTGSGQTQGSGVMAAYDSSTKVILAESGVTAGFNIRDVRMTQLVGVFSDEELSRTAVTNTYITVVETLGTSFLEKMRNAAAKLRIKNIKECPYFLELSFKGYTEDGEPVNNLMQEEGLGQGGRWIYSLAISNIETSFDAGGSEYIIEAKPFSFLSTNDEFGRVSDMLVIKGRTVGEMLTSFAEALNRATANRYLTDLATYKFVTHPIDGLEGEDISTFPIASTEPELNDATNLSLEDGMPTIHVRSGSIADTVNTILANCPRIQEMTKNVNRNTDTDVSEEQSVETRAREVFVFKSEPEVVHREYEPLTGRYKTQITYHIHGFYTQRPIVSRQQVEDAKDPEVQAMIVKRWRDKGFLQKRYDYFYTGKNTEVINIDTKFNFKWSAILPMVYGHRLTNESVTTHARYNESVLAGRNHLGDLQRIRDQIANAEEKRVELLQELSEIEDTESEEYVNKQREIEANSIERTTLYRQATVTNNAITNARTQAAEAQPEQDSPPQGTVIYAEDLGELTEEEALLAVSFSQQDTRRREGEGASAPYHRDRGLFGAILDQLYTQEFLRINLEIRGDPFWLGQSDLERRDFNASSQVRPERTTADYHQGENLILLTMAFPYSIDSDGNIIMRTQEDGSGRRDIFDGFYTVTTVEHIFEGGQFRQVLTGQRFQLIQLINQLGYQSENQALYDDLNQQVSPTGEPGGANGAAAAPGTAPPATGTKANDMQVVYGRLRELGYSEEGARTMVAQIGRENGFQRDIMFGSHDDPYNAARNSGLISWQGDRGANLRNYMSQRGFVNPDGTFVRSDASLRAQVDFMDQELRTVQAFRPSYNAMRTGTSYASIEPVVGDNYVRWRRTDPRYSSNGYRNQNYFYSQIVQLTGPRR